MPDCQKITRHFKSLLYYKIQSVREICTSFLLDHFPSILWNFRKNKSKVGLWLEYTLTFKYLLLLMLGNGLKGANWTWMGIQLFKHPVMYTYHQSLIVGYEDFWANKGQNYKMIFNSHQNKNSIMKASHVS